MIKRALIVLAVLAVPLVVGLFFAFDIIKLDWVSFMEIQPSFQAQEDPLPLPPRSVPVQGAAYIPGLGAPLNPVPSDDVSLKRGEQLYNTSCALCHGPDGNGKGPFTAFLVKYPPANLAEELTDLSDGDFFMTITNGIEGRMPSLRENLPTARDRWDVVNYVRALQKAAAGQ